MNDREKIIRYYKSTGDDIIAAKLLDLAENVIKTRKYKVTDFIDPQAALICDTISAHYKNIKIQFFGGYENAERIKAAFIHQDFMGTENYEINALKISWADKYYNIGHRDLLGALLGLGITRDLIGDIIVQAGFAQILIDETIKPFLTSNLTQVGSAIVTIDELKLDNIIPPEPRVKEIKATVASLRLDAVAAVGFGVSRSRMSSDIAAENIKLNWKTAKSSSQDIKVGDLISARGRGRVEVCEILGLTKKGRYSIYLKRTI